MDDQTLIRSSAMELAWLRSQNMTIPIHLADPAAAMALVGALQLACRHAGFSEPTRDLMVEIIDQIEVTFVEAGSLALVELIQRGWDPQYDV